MSMIEHFTEYQKGGVPYLRGRKHHKTMWLSWGDGSVLRYMEFARVIEHSTMGIELQAIWERYLSQCNRRAVFQRGGVHGFMGSVPIPAGLEAMAVVHEHFTKALELVKYMKPIECD